MALPASPVRGRLAAWLTVAGAIALAALVVGAPEPDNPDPVSRTGLSGGWQSTQVERLAARLPSGQTQAALIVISREDGAPLTADDVETITTRSSELAPFATAGTAPDGQAPDGSQPTGGAGGRLPPPAVSPDRSVALLTVPIAAGDGYLDTVQTVTDLRAALRDWPRQLRTQVTGSPAFAADLSAVFDGADVTLLAVTAGVVALLLLITYRSPLLWLVPLAVVAGAEQLTQKATAIVVPALGIHLDEGQTMGIASVLVFGAATDYALLLIARYRDELRREADRFAAMGRALRRTATPVLASGGTVVLAVGTLLLSARETNRALAVACGIGVLLAMAAALLVLPATLVLCGRGVFWPLVPRVGDPAREGRIWGRLGAVAAGRPVAVATGATLALAALATGILGLRTGLSETEQFRVRPEAVLGAQTLARAFPAGTTQPATVLTGETAADAVAAAAKGVPGVASVTVAERASGTARLEVVLASEPGTATSDRTLRRLRDAVGAVAGSAPPAALDGSAPPAALDGSAPPAALDGSAPPAALDGSARPAAVAARPEAAVVGGPVAQALDIKDANARDQRLILPLILLLVGAVLVLLLRGIVAPLLLVATVIASFAASLGASWLLFDHVLGFPALDSGVLLLAFVFLVALGVDYNIFLVTRAREDAATAGTRAGMLSALRVTGGVITSAGILLAAVFAVLGVLPLITLTQIGVIVCVGVLLDTLLVRTVLVPALAFRLGDRFWWPGHPTTAPPDEPAVTP